MLNWIVWNGTVLCANWIVWNRTVFGTEPVLTLNWIVWNITIWHYWIPWNRNVLIIKLCTYAKLNYLKYNCLFL